MFIDTTSKRFQLTIKIFCLLAIVLLLVFSGIEVLNLAGFRNHPPHKTSSIGGIILNTISCILCVYIYKHPSRLEIAASIFLYYCIWIDYIDSFSFVPIFLFFLSFIFFYITGFYEKFTILKYIVTIIIYLILILTPLRLGFFSYISSLIQNLAVSFCSVVLIFILFVLTETKSNSKYLNLHDFPELTQRDSEWLNALLNNEKYESIAIRYEMSPGSVKNRFKVIFKTLGLAGKTDFLNKYSRFTIIYSY